MFSFSTFYNVYLPFRYNNAPSICTLLYLPGTVSASPSLCLPLQSSVHPARLRNETLRVGVHMGSRFLFTVEFPGQGEWWWEVTDWAQWSIQDEIWSSQSVDGSLIEWDTLSSLIPSIHPTTEYKSRKDRGFIFTICCVTWFISPSPWNHPRSDIKKHLICGVFWIYFTTLFLSTLNTAVIVKDIIVSSLR